MGSCTSLFIMWVVCFSCMSELRMPNSTWKFWLLAFSGFLRRNRLAVFLGLLGDAWARWTFLGIFQKSPSGGFGLPGDTQGFRALWSCDEMRCSRDPLSLVEAFSFIFIFVLIVKFCTCLMRTKSYITNLSYELQVMLVDV